MIQNELFKKIEEHHQSQLPFVVFKEPNSFSIKAILQKEAVLHTISDYTQNGFVFAPFDDASTPLVFFPNNVSNLYETNFEKEEFVFSIFNDNYSEEEKQNHLHLVEKGIKAIEENQFKKVVLSRSETISTHNTIPILDCFKKLIQLSNAFVYAFYHPKVGAWLGATPETLLKVDNKVLETMSLAGTKLKEENWTNKEYEEQQFVTDFIVDNLKPFVSGLEVSKVSTIKSGNVEHLKTVITGKPLSSEFNLRAIIKQLHPTPAVCGLPKEKSKQFILNNEAYNRAYYTGFLGELNCSKKTQLYVNLRCMQLKDNEALIYVGGGVTKDSVPKLEWEETIRKSQVMKRILF